MSPPTNEFSRRHWQACMTVRVDKLIILDRDGVINQDRDDYVKSCEEWIPIPSSLKRLRILILPTCVGLRYGLIQLKLSGFSWKHGINHFTYKYARYHVSTLTPRICLRNLPTRLNRDIQHPADLTFSVPTSHCMKVQEY